MKLLEATGTEAIELLADLIDPVSELLTDEEIVKCIETKQNLKAVKFALKRHSKEVLEVMAICEGVPVKEYRPRLADIPAMLLEILNNPDIAKLFTSQAQTAEPSFGSVTEITEVPAQ